LYQSHGITPESVLEVASENGVDVEMPGNFYAQLKAEDEGEPKDDKGPSVKILFTDIASLPKTKPLYYSREGSFKAKALAVVKGKYLILDQSAFYPESGGQVSDGGTIDGKKVLNVTRQAGVLLHEVKDASSFKAGQDVAGEVDLQRRMTITRHHTAAHLVNAACKAVLGPHIWQGGSHKDDQKAHLDVTHYRKISPEEVRAIEAKVNEYIMADMPIETDILPRNTAEERYGFPIYQGGAVPGKELRIVRIGDVDAEACGGTHTMLSSTGQIGMFKIVKRESVQDGIERIVYKCGTAALAYVQEREAMLQQASDVLSVSEHELVRSVERFFNEWRAQRKKIESLSEEVAREELESLLSAKKPQMRMLELDAQALRKMGTKIAESDSAAACLINKEGNLVCAAGSSSGRSAKAMLDKVLAELGGSGGGSERIAQGKAQRPGIIEAL